MNTRVASGLAGPYFAGEQAHTRMALEQFDPVLDLPPAFGVEQLFGAGAVGERSFPEAEKCFKH